MASGGGDRYVMNHRGIRTVMDFWPEIDDQQAGIPTLNGEVWILGKRYASPKETKYLVEDVRSKLWFTYRRNFRPIGDTSYTSDSGWGCTLRCGQMMLGQALIMRHLGRDWRWQSNDHDDIYKRILRKFLDSRDSEYSIQMIALQGADFGRSVGQWFGPNNVAQSIKRLVAHDTWSKIAVHVAMDMLVIIDDIKRLCREPHGITGSIEVTTFDGDSVQTPKSLNLSTSDPSLNNIKSRSTTSSSKPLSISSRHSRAKTYNLFSPKSHSMSRSYDPCTDSSLLNIAMEDLKKPIDSLIKEDDHAGAQIKSNDGFRPLLLFIPLRLGQEKFNVEYAEAIKSCLELKQSVGLIGGKPRHALWFIGYNDNHLLYLDPHKTQNSVPIPSDDQDISDMSYHCSTFDKIHIGELDPSLALGFFCKDEHDIDDLCVKLKSHVLSKMSYLFELTQHRPSYWGLQDTAKHSSKEPFVLLQVETNSAESDEGFELVEWPYPAPLQVSSNKRNK